MTKPIKTSQASFRQSAAGFSLAEIMVGMVIGLLTIIVIMQSFSVFEGQKRTTTTGSDTQENGLLGMQAIESDARNAGYGLITPQGLACTSINIYESFQSATSSVAPVQVLDGGAAGGSDTIIFTAATSPIAGTPSKLNIDVPNSQFEPDIDNTVGFTIDQDLFIIASPIASPGIGAAGIPCSRVAYNDPATVGGTTIFTSSSATFYPVGGYPRNSGVVIDIGSGLNGAAGFVRTQYRVDSNNDLLVDDVSHFGLAAATTRKIASNIVNLQVQYGVAPVNTQPGVASPSVTCWTDATGNACNSSSGNWAAPNASDIMRIKAIRVAVVARSSLQEKPAVSGVSTACNATTTAPVSWSGGPSIDLSANANWQCHRYRVYQTVIPLRNVIWGNL